MLVLFVQAGFVVDLSVSDIPEVQDHDGLVDQCAVFGVEYDSSVAVLGFVVDYRGFVEYGRIEPWVVHHSDGCAGAFYVE